MEIAEVCVSESLETRGHELRNLILTRNENSSFTQTRKVC
jgi:hypothetical protein